MFSQENRRLTRKLINDCKYLTGGNQENGFRLFPAMSSNRARGSRHKLEVPYAPEEKFLYFDSDRALEETAHIGSGVSFSGDIGNLSGCFSVQHTVGNLL